MTLCRWLLSLIFAGSLLAQVGNQVGSSVGTPGASGSGSSSSVVVPQAGGLITLGDSITAGSLASPNTLGYAFLLAGDAGANLTDLAVSGQQACDLADSQALKSVLSTADNNPLYTMMIGTNDANVKGPGSYEAVYKNCHQAALAWVSDAYKFAANSTNCTDTGTWVAMSGYALNGESSTTNGSTKSCTITTTGGPIYAWYYEADGSGGTFTYAVDGGSAVSLSTATTPAIATQNGGTTGWGLIRVSGLSSGAHTILFTVTSATSTSNNVQIAAVGTTVPITKGAPRVYVGQIIKQVGNANATAVNAYNVDALADVALLLQDGLPLSWVPTQNYVCVSVSGGLCYNAQGVDDMAGGANTLHPNNVGHNDLKQAFENTMQFVQSGACNSNTQTASANYTLQNTDCQLFINGGGGTVFTLPNSLTKSGPYIVTNTSVGTPLSITLGSGASASASFPTQIDKLATSIFYQNSGVWYATTGPGSYSCPSISEAASYTITTGDCFVVMNGSGLTLTLPAFGSNAFNGPYFVQNYSANPVTIAAGSGATLHTGIPTTLPGYGWLTLYQNANSWNGYESGVVSSTACGDNTQTASYTITSSDCLVIMNGSGLTLTLAALGSGVFQGPFYIENYSANTLTIAAGTGAFIHQGIPSTLGPYGSLTLYTTANTWINFAPTVYYGVSASLGGSALTAGQCSYNSTTITGAQIGMGVTVGPTTGTDAGPGMVVRGFVSAANTVNTQICAAIAGTPNASTYSIRVIP